MPQNNITPCGVEADGHQLLVPLDAVDGQLAGGGGGPDGGGVIDHIEHHRRRAKAGQRRPPFFPDKKYPYLFPFFDQGRITPVLK